MKKVIEIKGVEDNKIFSDAINNPPEPNEALKKLASKYKELIKNAQ